MKHFESHWENKAGLVFYVQGWEPDQSPKAVVAFIHGLGEHTGRYTHVGEAFTRAGYALAAFDLRGHGKTGGPRGHFPSLQAAMRDISEFFTFLHGRYPKDLPFFLYGHSLGGLLALTYTLHNRPDVKGVVVTSPGLRSALQSQNFKITMARVLGSLTPGLTLASGLDPSTISRDPRVVEAYIHDPLVHDKTSMGFGKSALDAIDFAFANAANFPVPLLIMHGTADKLTFPSGSEDFIKLVPGDATFVPWEGLYHETHNEPEKAQVLQTSIDWMDRHLNSR